MDKLKTVRKVIIGGVAALTLLTFSAVGPVPHAGAIETGLDATAKTAGYNTNATTNQSVATITASVIRRLLELVGVIFLVLLIYAGFRWMTAGGNEEAIKDAKQMLLNAVIGLVIVLAGYAITSFVLQSVMMATGTGQKGP